MQLFLKIIKILLSALFLAIILGCTYFLILYPKEERFNIAGNMQGSLLSQRMYDILTMQYPNYSEAYFEQSVAHNKYGNYARGFELLNQAVAIDPSLHLGYRGYMKLRFLRDYDGALVDFERLDRLTPNFNDAPWGENIEFLRGECYFGKKDYTKAIELFNLNVKNNKEGWVDVHTFVYIGLCEFEMGNFEKSIEAFQRTLAQADRTPEAYLGMSKAYEKLGDLDKAEKNIMLAEEHFIYKRDDPYKEYLNEIYLSDVAAVKERLAK